jgi:hypothetical protein
MVSDARVLMPEGVSFAQLGLTGGPRELVEAMRAIATTGVAPADQKPSIGCSIKWRRIKRSPVLSAPLAKIPLCTLATLLLATARFT